MRRLLRAIAKCRAQGAALLLLMSCAPELPLCNSDAECINNASGPVCALGMCTTRERTRACDPTTDAHAVVVTVHERGAPAALGLCGADVSAVSQSGASTPLTELEHVDGTCTYALSAPSAIGADAIALKVRFFGHDQASLPVVLDQCSVSVDVALDALADACHADDACPLRCVVDVDVPTARCGFIDGGRPIGAGCAAHGDCDHGVCVDGLCSALCSVDDDQRTCAPSQRCSMTPLLPGALACVPANDLPVTACTNDAACEESARICADLVDDGAQCVLPTPGRSPLGGACADEGESQTCASGLCDDEIAGRCTRACARDDDCDGMALDICTASGIEGTSARLCMQQCAAADQCASGKVCRARADVVDDMIEHACDGPRGVGAVGDLVESGAQCQTNFSLLDDDGSRYCSVACAAPTDCPSSAPRCRQVTLQRPSGTSTQATNACTRDE